MNTSSIKTTNKKKSFRVTFAPGTKTEEEQISNFVRAVENQGPGIDDLSNMIKSLPNKKVNAGHSKEAQSISNMIVQLRKTLDNMLETTSDTTINNTNSLNFNSSITPFQDSSMKISTDLKIMESPERRSSNSSITSVDSAISDCDNSDEYYKNLINNEKKYNINNVSTPVVEQSKKETTTVTSPQTRQKVTNLLKELNTCIEELREENISMDEENNISNESFNTDLIISDATCVKDVFAAGILIASFVRISFNNTQYQCQYSILSDNKIFFSKSNRSKSPLSNVFDFTTSSNVKRLFNDKYALVLSGKFMGIYNEIISNEITLLFSTEEECNIWYNLLKDVINVFNPAINLIPERTISLNANVNNEINSNMACYNPRQTLLSALCVLENVNNKIIY